MEAQYTQEIVRGRISLVFYEKKQLRRQNPQERVNSRGVVDLLTTQPGRELTKSGSIPKMHTREENREKEYPT